MYVCVYIKWDNGSSFFVKENPRLCNLDKINELLYPV